jgi:hypothetical protein
MHEASSEAHVICTQDKHANLVSGMRHELDAQLRALCMQAVSQQRQWLHVTCSTLDMNWSECM